MQIYLVGGAVRDNLLNRRTVDEDYVVVGATVQEMLDKGFKPVGKDFPVFLHPKTKSEYALARTERKKGMGHKGFECNSSSDVTLEQDLLRRDLTINAMAMDGQGNIIDPYNGQRDIKNRVLRHVSSAFEEDPLRVFRVARFAARFAAIGFIVDESTLAIMQRIANSGELQTLSSQRVWQETSRALQETTPHVFFEILKRVDALTYWFKELDHIIGRLPVLSKASQYSEVLQVRYAALLQSLDNGANVEESNLIDINGNKDNHEASSHNKITQLNKRLSVPNDCAELAQLTNKHCAFVHSLYKQTPKNILNMFNAIDAWRKPDRMNQLLLVCKADYIAKHSQSNDRYPQMESLLNAHEQCLTVSAKPLVAKGIKGTDIRDAINKQRLDIIRDSIEELEK